MVYLIAQLFPEKNPERLNEFLAAIEANLNHPDLQIFYLFVESDDLSFLSDKQRDIMKTSRCELIFTGKHRLTFKEAVEFANTKLPVSSFALIINLDIEIDKGSSFKFNGQLEGGKISLALSRHERDEKTGELYITSYILKRYGATSQDAWGFITPYDINLKGIDFPIGGAFGCDSAVAYWMQKSSQYPVNMAYQYKIIHHDNLTVSMDGGKLFVDDCRLSSYKDLRAVSPPLLFTPVIYNSYANFGQYRTACNLVLTDIYPRWISNILIHIEEAKRDMEAGRSENERTRTIRMFKDW
jgi:hypothetical protein